MQGVKSCKNSWMLITLAWAEKM